MSQTYTFRASNGTSVTMFRGDGAPKMTAGGGGWTTVDRPRRIGMTVWNGRDPYGMDVPVLFDGYIDSRSVEGDIAKLNQMQMGAALNQPPTVMIDGQVPVKGIRWVITGIDWGDNVYWDAAGRQRQDAVVHLLQYVKEERVDVIGKDPTPTPARWVTKKGDTLRSVAARVYGDSSQWKVIANAQKPPLRILGDKPLQPQTTLRIP